MDDGAYIVIERPFDNEVELGITVFNNYHAANQFFHRKFLQHKGEPVEVLMFEKPVYADISQKLQAT